MARTRIARAILTAVAAAGLIAAGTSCTSGNAPPTTAPSLAMTQLPHPVPLGAFLGSDASGVAAVASFQAWLGPAHVTVGRTYLPGTAWSDIEGDPEIIQPWAAWLNAAPGRTLALDVPMLAPNEAHLPDAAVAPLLRQGASGAFDQHFVTLAQRLVAAKAAKAVIVLGWEMNGTTYTGRCAPDPSDWKAYWRSIVTAMRSVPGAAFRFDFDPTRGTNAIPWTSCYPGDDVVDIVGMDSYDQAPGQGFDDYVTEPYGLEEQVGFAAQHGKPVSYPEWGLYDYGDDPSYVADMYHWINTHNTVYESITDYCPSGVFECTTNPQSSGVYRDLFGSPSPVASP